jgi:type I restriction enzyme S subunit
VSFPRYPDYKDSGVEWLGQVPAHWSTVQLRHVLSFSTGWTPPTGDASSFEGENLWANISDLGERVIRDTAKRISDDAVVSAGIAPVEAGSLLYSFKLSIGQVSFAGREMYTNEAIAAFPPNDSIDLRYAYYALPFLLEKNAAENIYGAKLLNQALIKSAALLLPPVAEQCALASFLDRETAKIDALVAEQERLIALLKEKRQAVISHAVTKGLNPDAPMKESGVDWLGQVPAHWRLDRLQAHCQFISGRAHEPFVDEDGEHLCVTSRFVSTNGVAERRCTVNLEPARPGDSLVVMSDLPNGRALARSYFVADDRSYAVNQRVCALRPTTAHPRFLHYLIDRNPELLRHDDGVNQTHLSNSDFLKPRFPFPPRDEQEAIAAFLDTETGLCSDLIMDAGRLVAALQERRATLITVTVTGQIDVRGLAPAEAA